MKYLSSVPGDFQSISGTHLGAPSTPSKDLTAIFKRSLSQPSDINKETTFSNSPLCTGLDRIQSAFTRGTKGTSDNHSLDKTSEIKVGTLYSYDPDKNTLIMRHRPKVGKDGIARQGYFLITSESSAKEEDRRITDKDIALTCIKKNPNAFVFVSNTLRNDVDFLKEAFNQNPKISSNQDFRAILRRQNVYDACPELITMVGNESKNPIKRSNFSMPIIPKTITIASSSKVNNVDIPPKDQASVRIGDTSHFIEKEPSHHLGSIISRITAKEVMKYLDALEEKGSLKDLDACDQKLLTKINNIRTTDINISALLNDIDTYSGYHTILWFADYCDEKASSLEYERNRGKDLDEPTPEETYWRSEASTLKEALDKRDDTKVPLINE